ncbi:MAG TPA: hypothetical protein VFE46_19440 [Pirellulales bacterium]|jgi:hypothetical protein|nr:hypothetical protein [Pirellulales bacterium]
MGEILELLERTMKKLQFFENNVRAARHDNHIRPAVRLQAVSKWVLR